MNEMTPEVRHRLDRPNYAHLATLMPDGAPHSVPVWIAIEGDNLAILTGHRERLATSSATLGWRSRSLTLISRTRRC
jgi:hypothetical protein